MSQGKNKRKNTSKSAAISKQVAQSKEKQDDEDLPVSNAKPKWIVKASNSVWALVGLLSTLLGLLGVLTLFPKVAADFTNSLNPKHPFKSILVVRNEGIFSIKEVNYTCFVEQLSRPPDFSITAMEFDPNLYDIPVIEGDEAYSESFQFGRIFDGHEKQMETVADADVYFLFTYKYLGITCHKAFRFVGARTPEGQFVWSPQTADKRVIEMPQRSKMVRQPKASRSFKYL